MKRRNQILIALFSVIVFTGIMVMVIMSLGEPAYKIKIENGTEQGLTIYYDAGRIGSPRSLGTVEPGEYIYTSYFDMADTYCQIDTKDVEGEVIFSKEYDWWELREMDWEVVITLPEN